jgi:hypothetical protein
MDRLVPAVPGRFCPDVKFFVQRLVLIFIENHQPALFVPFRILMARKSGETVFKRPGVGGFHFHQVFPVFIDRTGWVPEWTDVSLRHPLSSAKITGIPPTSHLTEDFPRLSRHLPGS